MKIQEQYIDGERWVKFNSEWDRRRYYWGIIINIILIIFVVGISIYFMFWMTNYGELLRTNPCKLCEEAYNYTCYKITLP